MPLAQALALASAERAQRHPRLAVIINEAAGTAARQGTGSMENAVSEALTEAGLEAETRIVASADIGAAITKARDAAKRGALDAIVVGGGDGTIRAAAERLAGTGIPLAILPLGTLNHFAKDLGIPVDLPGAARVIAEFQTRKVDAGEVNGELFINNSSIGIYPYMVVDRERRRGLYDQAKWAAMALALLRALRRFPRRRLTVDAGANVVARRTPCLFIGNNAYDVNFLSLGRKLLDAGRLYIYVARQRRPLALLWLVLKLGLGLKTREGELDLIAVAEATIRSRASRLLVALDGEVRTLATPLRYRSLPEALTVVVPAPGR